jgi:hypothetical protein
MTLWELIDATKTRDLTSKEALELQKLCQQVATNGDTATRERLILAVVKNNPGFRQQLLDMSEITEYWDEILLLEPGTPGALAVEKQWGITLEELKPYARGLVGMVRAFAFVWMKKVDEA